jgi:hypothetical protein
MSIETRRIKSIERTRSRRIRISIIRWLILILNALLDAKHGIPRVPGREREHDIDTHTSTIKQIATLAGWYANVQGDYFKNEASQKWELWDGLTRDLAHTQAELASVRQLIGPRQSSRQEGEKLRRLMRHIHAIERRLPLLTAAINGRFRQAQLATSCFYDYSDKQVTVYWRTLRRHHTAAEGLSDTPPVLERPAWLSVSDGASVLEAWNRSAIAHEYPETDTPGVGEVPAGETQDRSELLQLVDTKRGIGSTTGGRR